MFEHFRTLNPCFTANERVPSVLRMVGLFPCAFERRILVDAYMKGRISREASVSFHQPAMHDNSRMDILNYTAYMDGEHKHLFDPEGLLNILFKGRVQRVEQRQFDEGFGSEVHDWRI